MLPVIYTNTVFAWVFAVSVLVWAGSEAYRMWGRRPGQGARAEDRRSTLLLNLCIWGGILVANVAASRFPQFAIPWQRVPLFFLGIALMWAGVLFRWYAIRVLGRYFTSVIAIQPEHRIVEAGPYRLVRHPSYSGALVTFLGYALALGNWLSLVIVAVCMTIGYGYRIAVEEQALVNAMGDSYRAYMKRTKRIIPFVI
jgi:protein-S-isoprenylcysteine O-methyltransferase Ste14